MRIGIISIIGQTAPVVTEAVEYIARQYFPKDRIYNIIVRTKDPSVVETSEFAKLVIDKEFNEKIVTIFKDLSMSDFSSEEDINNFIEEVSKIISEEENKFNLDRVYLNITGGRKVQIMLLYLVSLFDRKVYRIMNIINKNIKNVNVGYEQIKKFIEKGEFTEKEYNMYIKDVMFPDRTTYSIIELPRVILPSNLINQILDILENEAEGVNSEILNILEKMKAIQIDKYGSYTITEFGFLLKKVIKMLYYGSSIY